MKFTDDKRNTKKKKKRCEKRTLATNKLKKESLGVKLMYIEYNSSTKFEGHMR